MRACASLSDGAACAVRGEAARAGGEEACAARAGGEAPRAALAHLIILAVVHRAAAATWHAAAAGHAATERVLKTGR